MSKELENNTPITTLAKTNSQDCYCKSIKMKKQQISWKKTYRNSKEQSFLRRLKNVPIKEIAYVQAHPTNVLNLLADSLPYNDAPRTDRKPKKQKNPKNSH